MLTRIIPFPPALPDEIKPHAGHFADPVPGERPWVPIDGVMIRGYVGHVAGHLTGHAYICGLECGARTRTQAMLCVPMDAPTLQAIGDAFLVLADLARRVAAEGADAGSAANGPT